MKRFLLLLLCAGMVTGCQLTKSNPSVFDIRQGTRVAFLADIHFHDIYGELSDGNIQGLPTNTPDGQKNALIRSMASQLQSTRLFNENYFVLITALDDLARKGVKLVALPGDFTDDGQPIHLRGLATLLQQYRDKYNMRFFAIPGNHDPVRPFTIEGGKADFLASDGSEFGIYSHNSKQCQNNTPNVVCSDDLKKSGYQEILTGLANFGFQPQPNDVYYETPFTTAQSKGTSLSERAFTWCEKDQPDNCIAMPDASYLVEPVPGIWLLAIDANVYVPKDANKLSTNGKDFSGSSNAGYNALFRHKPQLVTWIKDVVQRAKAQNKELVAFSHFPMTDFYDGAKPKIAQLFGKDKLQLRRMPLSQTAQALADTGLTLHVGGHMHINDTGRVTGQTGNTLFNIQAPSLAAYRPGYKLLILNKEEVFVETVVLDNVNRFNELFGHYRKEHRFLAQHQPEKSWNDDILKAEQYGEFTDKHLQALIRQRYLPREWPKPLVSLLETGTIGQLIDKISPVCKHSQMVLNRNVLNPIAPFPALTLVDDFYRLRNADSIALVDGVRKNHYMELSTRLKQCDFKPGSAEQKLSLMLAIMADFITAQPSKNIRLNLASGKIDVMSVSRKRVPLNPYFLDLEALPASQATD